MRYICYYACRRDTKRSNGHDIYNLQTGVRLPEGASAALAKPTKYHYYPHNQHIYLLPECAVQQVCNAVYVRLNFTQPLCACPGRYRDPCSASLDSNDLHTTELVTDPRTKVSENVESRDLALERAETGYFVYLSSISFDRRSSLPFIQFFSLSRESRRSFQRIRLLSENLD